MAELATVQQVITNIYHDFQARFTPENCPRMFAYFHQMAPNERGHELGHFAILYTPITTVRPKLMLIGNNPSWFDRNNMQIALAIVQEMEEGIPNISSYLQHNHVFALQLQEIFHNILNRPDLLQNCVGMNRFWVQTGPAGIEELRKRPRNHEYQQIQHFCERKTMEIISNLEPRVVILLGRHAQKSIPNEFRLRYPTIAFEHARYPANGGIDRCAADIDRAIQNNGL